jgi:hypothetical protein
MDIPSNFQDLLAQLAGGVLFLGFASAALTAALWKFHENLLGLPNLPANWKRLISLLMPFMLAMSAYLVQVWLGYAIRDIEALYSVLVTAFMAATGKQAAFVVYEAVKPSKDAQPDNNEGAMDSVVINPLVISARNDDGSNTGTSISLSRGGPRTPDGEV